MCKRSTNSTTSSTKIDPALMSLYQQNYNSAQAVANRPYQPYTGTLVAPFNETQQAAQQQILDVANSNVGGSTLQSAIDAAQNATNYAPSQVGTDINPYMLDQNLNAPQIAPSTYNPLLLGQNYTAPSVTTNYSLPTIGTNFQAPQAAGGYVPQNIGMTFNAPNISGAGYNPAQAGTSYTPQQIAAGQLSETNLDPYMNPYTQAVTDQTLASLERQRQVAENQTAMRQTAAKAFGGSRHGVADALTNEAYGRTAAEVLAALNAQNFTQAQNAATTDLNRSFAAGQSNQAATTDAARINQAAELANQDAGYKAAQLAQAGDVANAQALLQSQGLALNAAQSNQAAGLDAARVNQGYDLANMDAALAAQGLNLDAAQSNQNAAATAAGLSQTGELAGLDAWIASQGLGLQAGQANQGALLDAARLGQTTDLANLESALATQGLNLNAGIANQGATLDAAQLNQAGQIANQNAGLDAAQLDLYGSGLLGDFSGAELQQAIQRAGLTGAVGAEQQNLQQAQADAAYQQWLRQWNYPIQQQDIRNAAVGMIPVQSTMTSTQKSTPGLLDYISGLAGPAAEVYAASDERLKEDVRTTHWKNGVRYVSWRWKDDASNDRQFGVIAQEIEKTHPHAVKRMHNGYLGVDYAALEAA